MAPRPRGSPATTGCEVVRARRSARPRTPGTCSSTAETLRRQPSREYERARLGEAGRSLWLPAGGHAGFGLLPVVQVGSDLGAEVNELKLGLDPRHTRPPSRVHVVLNLMLPDGYSSLTIATR